MALLAVVVLAGQLSAPSSAFGTTTAAAAAPGSDPIIGDWSVTYGAPAVVTILLEGSTYTVVAKTPVRVTGSSCDLPVGTLIATFSLVSGNTYSGQHGLWHISDCVFATFTSLSLTLNGNTLTGVLSGGFGTVVFTKIGPPTSLSAAAKANLQALSNALSDPFFIWGFVAATAIPCLLFPVLIFACVALAIIGGILGTIAYVAGQQAANDPPDPNFHTVAKPVIQQIHLPTNLRSHLTKNELSTFAELTANLEKEIALHNAAITAHNRAVSAIAAGDQADAVRQSRAFFLYNDELSEVLLRQITARNDFIAAWAKPLGSLTITPSEVTAAQSQIAKSGVPVLLADLMRDEGVPQAVIDSAATAFVSADPNHLAASSLSSQLVSPTTMTLLNTLAQNLEADAQANGGFS